MMERLTARMSALGVRNEVNTAVQQLVREGDRIIGVRAKSFDEQKSIRARGGVILATGHFTGNEEMLRKHTPRLLEAGITRQYTPFDDGAGHQLGAAAGGVLLHMDGALITSPFYPPEQLIKGILVNRLGRRFVAEDSYHSRSSIYATQEPGGEAYLIVDEKIFARPLFGPPAERIPDGIVPVFWACGVTPQQAALDAKVELLLAHAPAHGFITDLPAEALASF